MLKWWSKSGEPFLLPRLCCFSHTAQSLGHSFPALGQTRVGLSDVLLGPHPSLPGLRGGFPTTPAFVLTSATALACLASTWTSSAFNNEAAWQNGSLPFS